MSCRPCMRGADTCMLFVRLQMRTERSAKGDAAADARGARCRRGWGGWGAPGGRGHPRGPWTGGPGCLCSVISPLPASTPPRYHSLVSLPCYRLGNNGEWQCGTAALQWPITPHRCGDGPEAVHCGTGLRSAIFRLGPCAGARTCRRRQVLSRGCIGLSAADTAER